MAQDTALCFRHDNVNYAILPSEIAALATTDGNSALIYLRGGSNISLHDLPDEIIQSLTEVIMPLPHRQTRYLRPPRPEFLR